MVSTVVGEILFDTSTSQAQLGLVAEGELSKEGEMKSPEYLKIFMSLNST